ncbi:GNAT family N-acetyltransferase [Luteipulveratus sp. YIM 133132]|uniref:GNAT family N-acetyltransferase n=1 Tax=Luteipulveratus flavus TaxID=3031728 RepID=UPI0023AF077C|nr:GNAT family N-acetyltransferase [Luteipulveratus sp. YIM 133132]MDE9365095.1 GNAT family N-acetyltransferase [Luteipulveratus sp. YIM 133132]
MADVRVGPASDPERYLNTDLLVWFDEPPVATTEQLLAGFGENSMFGAEVDGADERTYAGVYGVYPLELTVPGPLGTLRQVPVAGLTWVGVHPDERRRGVLTAMLRDHFSRVGDGDWSGLSVLKASEPAIYGRHGYGVASWECTLRLSRGARLTAPGLEDAASALRTRLTDAADPGVPARMREVSLRVGADRLGAVVREERLYTRFTVDSPASVREREVQRVLLAQQDGTDVGFAWFRRKLDWENGSAAGEVGVIELVGTPAAELALLRRLVDLDLTTSVTIRWRSVDDPIAAWAGGPRGIQDATSDSLWVRLVDLPTALGARGYAAQCDVVLEVEDAACPANHGRWRLVVDAQGRGTANRTDATPDVRLTTQTLASAYLGARSLVAQQQAGLLTEVTDGSVAALDTAMRAAQVPVAAVGF